MEMERAIDYMIYIICIYIYTGVVVSTPLKSISQLGLLFPINMETEKMFQTNNQLYNAIYIYIMYNKPIKIFGVSKKCDCQVRLHPF